MEAGEKELKKAFEDVTRNNVLAVLEYTKETRKLLREMEKKITALEFMARSQNELIGALRMQLANVQSKVYRGGTE